LLVDDKVVISVKFPELAIDHVEMLVREVVGDHVDVVLVVERVQNLGRIFCV